MDIRDIQKFQKDLQPIFTGVLGGTSDEQVMAQLLRVQEELGEVTQSVFGELGKQINGKTFSDAGSEMADVILATFALAQRMDIDLDEKIKAKMEVVKERFDA